MSKIPLLPNNVISVQRCALRFTKHHQLVPMLSSPRVVRVAVGAGGVQVLLLGEGLEVGAVGQQPAQGAHSGPWVACRRARRRAHGIAPDVQDVVGYPADGGGQGPHEQFHQRGRIVREDGSYELRLPSSADLVMRIRLCRVFCIQSSAVMRSLTVTRPRSGALPDGSLD